MAEKGHVAQDKVGTDFEVCSLLASGALNSGLQLPEELRNLIHHLLLHIKVAICVWPCA